MSEFAWYLKAVMILAIVGVITWVVLSIKQIPEIFKTVVIALGIIFALLWILRELIPRLVG